MIYKGITSLRNYLFDKEILPQFSPEIFTIGVGNLTVGGTGKTPMVNYLLQNLKDRNLGVISRGYGRKTKGYLHIDAKSTPETVGDEPFMLYKNNPDINFFVSEKRVEGYKKAILDFPEINTFILDDAFQHRYIKPHFNILLSDFHRPFYKDSALPFGRLREARSGAKRADAVVVTKVPESISEQEKFEISDKIKAYAKAETPIYFANYKPGNPINIEQNYIKDKEEAILISALGNNQLFYEQQAEKQKILEHYALRDHFNLSEKQLEEIFKKYPETKIITTEKDWVKIESRIGEKEKKRFYIPKIRVEVEDSFIKSIRNSLYKA